MKVSEARSKQLSLCQLGTTQRMGNYMCWQKLILSCLFEMLVEDPATLDLAFTKTVIFFFTFSSLFLKFLGNSSNYCELLKKKFKKIN